MNWIYKSHTVGEFKDFFVVEINDSEESTKQQTRHIQVGVDVSSEHEKIKADASELWTPEVIAAYEAQKSNVA